MSSAAPLEGIHVAVNRSAPETAAAGAFLPDQALALGVAWDAYTLGSAYVNRRETSTGALRVGFDADLVVLDRDPFAGPREQISSARVVGTWVDGIRVWGNG